jgi:carbon monoxide dehydrogenase subunit G
VAAPVREVHAVLVDLERYVEWWPQVRAVAKVDDDHAIAVCRSVLPYDLELGLTALDRSVRRLRVGLSGPLEGWAQWRLDPSGAGTRVRFEQEVTVVGRAMVAASYLARPVLSWNHHRMMRGATAALAERFG